MMGITQATLAAWRGGPVSKAEVKALRREEAAAIYSARYWNAVRGDELPAGLDLALFDLAVNSGPSRAIRMLQGVLGVSVDGRIGPITLRAAHEADGVRLVRALCAARLDFLRRLSTFPVFGRGWTRRVVDIERNALALVSETPRSLSKTQETTIMDLTKTILSSRTIWANAVGFAALALSLFGFDTSGVDKAQLTETLLQVIAGVSFIASTLFRVIATKRLL
jgi:lysozyme family protein